MPGFADRRPTIGVLPAWSPVVENTHDRYLSLVVGGIRNAARLAKCHLLTAWGIRRETVDPNDSCPAWPVVAPDSDFVPVGPWNTDGLIVLAPLRHKGRSIYLQELSRSGFPVLYIATGEEGPTISVDNAEGVRQALAHLAEHGHRRVACIAGDPHDEGDSAKRLAAYHAAAAEYGLEQDPRLVAQGWHTDRGGYTALKQLLASGCGFTAIMASDDVSAIGAMRALREAGLRIPDDIAIIGFDDQPEASAHIPALSTLHVPLREMGEQAVRLMLDHLAGRRQLASVQIPARLVTRQSCGCMPASVQSAGKTGSQESRHPRTEDNDQACARVAEQMVCVFPDDGNPELRERAYDICYGLVRVFQSALRHGDSSRFGIELMRLLQAMELMGLDMEAWQEAVSVLRREMACLPLAWDPPQVQRLAEDLLHQARAAISEGTHRLDRVNQFQLELRLHAMGMLSSHLGEMLDAGQVARAVKENAGMVGIQHAHVAVFEADGDDPVAWSILLEQEEDSQLHRFRTRGFPPPGLLSPGELLDAALLPLRFHDEGLGYMVFDGGDLSTWISIARQVAAALKVANLHQQVVELSLKDALTGLYNRRYFDIFLENEVVRSNRFQRPLTIALLDLDAFKAYNDEYGHPAGDEALRVVARCLLAQRRATDVVTRIGGDEFAILLPETDANGGRAVSTAICQALRGAIELKQPLTFSIGIAELGRGGAARGDVLVSNADQALYEAKRGGRNRLCVFEGQKPNVTGEML